MSEKKKYLKFSVNSVSKLFKVYWTRCRAELRLLYFSSWGSEIFSTIKGGLLKFQASSFNIFIRPFSY